MNAPEAELAKPLVTDIGHIILQVGNMEKALHLYHDTLGFELAPGQTSTVWKVIRTKGGELTLYQAEKVTSLVLHGEEDTLSHYTWPIPRKPQTHLKGQVTRSNGRGRKAEHSSTPGATSSGCTTIAKDSPGADRRVDKGQAQGRQNSSPQTLQGRGQGRASHAIR